MTLYASKTPAAPRREYMECRHGEFPEDGPFDVCMCKAAWVEYPHDQHNPPNPILLELRKLIDDGFSDDASIAKWWNAVNSYGSHRQVREIEHARRVLTRLATITEGASA